MSSQLNFSSHINIIIDKACSKASWALLSIFQSRNKEIMMNLFKSIVRPLLEYCCPLWHPNNITDIQSLENVQRNFTSKISGLANLCYWDRLKQLNLMSLQQRRERFCIIYMWKILNCLAPNDINVKWNMNTRLGFKANIPNMSSNKKMSSIFESSFTVNGARLWNTLPKMIKL